MKSRIFRKWRLGLPLLVLPLTGGCLGEAADSPPVTTAPAPSQTNAAAPVVEAASQPEAVLPAAPTEAELADAPATPISTAKPVPATVRSTGPISEIIKLANSGVDESVMLAFVTNSPSTFNLGADEIIYLNDIGVPGSVVTAMIRRDNQLKRLASAAAPTASAPTTPTTSLNPAPAPATLADYYPAPADVAPQPDEQVQQLPLAPDTAYAPPLLTVEDGTFYDSLAPYGLWVDVAGYGRCWQPTVVVASPGWRPYFDGGHWVYTDCGWYWLSDYSWGWAPFHYGRWFRHHQMGWCWAPDRVWGPSWVSWRYTDNHCGWAPLPPAATYRPGFGFTYLGRSVGAEFSFGLSVDSFSFVAWNHFNDHRLRPFAVPHREADGIFHRSTAVTGIRGSDGHIFNHGVPLTWVAAATRTEIRPVSLRDTTPGPARVGRVEHLDAGARALTVFRPQLPAPARPGIRPDHAPAVTAAPAAPSHVAQQTPPPVPAPQPALPANAATRTPPAARDGRRIPPLIVIGRRNDPSPQAPAMEVGRNGNPRSQTLSQPSAPNRRQETPASAAPWIPWSDTPRTSSSVGQAPAAPSRSVSSLAYDTPIRSAASETRRYAPAPDISSRPSWSPPVIAPSRPAVSEAPHYSAPVSPAIPAHSAPAAESRSSSAQSSSRSDSSSDKNSRGR